MAVVTLATTTPQVRPLAGGAWNTITLTQGQAQKSTTFGVTLSVGMKMQALAACNQFINERDAGTSDRVAQKTARGAGVELQDAAALSTAQTGTGASTNVLDRGVSSGPATVTLVTTVGATPTVTVQLEGSDDNGTFAPLSSADSATPTVFSSATFAITSATTTVRIIDPAATAARYIRATYSANTNVTLTTTAATT